MEFIRHFIHLKPHHRHCVATIGNFDGVHLGHQVVINQLKNKAASLNRRNLVIIFEPQPQEFFSHSTVPARLTRLREKLLALQRYNVDYVLCLRFNRSFATLSAEYFIEHILIKQLAIEHLVVGDDFHFGQGRKGNFNTLQNYGKKYGFTVENWHTFILDNERVSSTRIRHALINGNFDVARQLLGRPYTLVGKVSYGQQRGRTIGFPTANIFLHRQVSPIKGVFAVKMHGIAAQPLTGVANLGTRPTVDGHHLLLETHLFDFNDSIYGHYVEIEFIEKLRDEQKFSSFDKLKQQIILDVQQARTIFQMK